MRGSKEGDRDDPNVAMLCASHSPLEVRDQEKIQGPVFREGINRARAFVENFDPDLVVFFGPDHRRALTNVVPAFTVVNSATGYGDWETPEGRYVVEIETSNQLAVSLLSSNFDVAVGTDIRLDHGFGQTWQQLFDTTNSRPILPIIINCAAPPFTSMRRTIALGRAVGRFISSLDRRVLYVASGGLSHDPPLTRESANQTEEERTRRVFDDLQRAAKRIDPAWDKRFLEAFSGMDWEWLSNLRHDELASIGVGAQEVRTWIAAIAAANFPATDTIYEPVSEWITGMGIAMGTGRNSRARDETADSAPALAS